jgi:glycosyltransferase involved in cell wall biosynthesis
MPTVGLNAHLLNLSASYRGAGIHQYIQNLVACLPAAAPHIDFVTFLNDKRMAAQHPTMQMRYSHWPTQNPAVRIVWEQAVQPLATFAERLDVLHALAFARPFVARCPVVLTIYDMSFAHMPERFPPLKRLYLRWMTRWSARRAACVTVISQSTKDDVIRYCGMPPGRVRVIYCGVNEQLKPLSRVEVDRFRATKGLPEHFILYLGTLEPRKNVAHLVRAFAGLQRNGSGRPRLIIAGAKGWGYAEVFAAVEEGGLAGDVSFAGYVPPEELSLWYNAADLFVYPSLYEGFGLPVAEAMACGTPAITSNVSSLPEVAGDAALTVAPGDVNALVQAMSAALHDTALRAAMRERGLAQAATFRWSETARHTAHVYEELLSRAT